MCITQSFEHWLACTTKDSGHWLACQIVGLCRVCYRFRHPSSIVLKVSTSPPTHKEHWTHVCMRMHWTNACIGVYGRSQAFLFLSSRRSTHAHTHTKTLTHSHTLPHTLSLTLTLSLTHWHRHTRTEMDRDVLTGTSPQCLCVELCGVRCYTERRNTIHRKTAAAHSLTHTRARARTHTHTHEQS